MKRIVLALAALLVLPVAAQAQQLQTLHSAASAAANGAVVNTGGAAYQTVVVQITTASSPTFQLAFEGSLDNSNYGNVTCFPQGSSTGATAITAVRSVSTDTSLNDRTLYRCDVTGYRYFRARIVSISVGTVTVKAWATNARFTGGPTTP